MENFPDKEKLFSQILEFKPRASDLRRMAIVEAIVEVLATDGAHQMTNEVIGRKAKMARSHIAYYFPNQEAMLKAAVEYVVATGQEITVAYVSQEKTPEGMLRAMIKATFDWLERYPKHRAVMQFLQYAALCDKHFKKLYETIESSGISRLETILKSQPAARKGKEGPKPIEVANKIRAHLVGSLVQIFTTLDLEKYPKQRAETEAFLFSIAKGYWA